MPHVIVKLWPGRSEQQKRELASAISTDVQNILGYGVESVSVALEEVLPRDWDREVYEPDIAAKLGQLYQLPGYGRLSARRK